MNITKLLDLITETAACRALITDIRKKTTCVAANILDAAKPYFIAALYRELKRPLLVVTAQPENSKRLYEQVSSWCDSSRIKLFPEADTLHYQRVSADTINEMERLRALSALSATAQSPDALIISSAPALMQKLTPHRDFVTGCHSLRPGMEFDPIRLLRKWQALGYRKESMVSVPGTISHRGGIIDIFPPTSDLPARLDFLGNTIESIRIFDPATQRSLRETDAIFICPTTELLALQLKSSTELKTITQQLNLTNLNPDFKEQFQSELAMIVSKQTGEHHGFYAPLFNTASIINYLPEETLVVLDEPESIKLTIDSLDNESSELYREKVTRGELPANFPKSYFSREELLPGIEAGQRLELTAWGASKGKTVRKLDFRPAPAYAGQLPEFIQKMKQLLHLKERLIVVTRQAGRISELLYEADIIAPPLNEIRQTPPPGSLTLIAGSLASGWVMAQKTRLITDAEIFGFVKQRRLPRHRHLSPPRPGAELVPGEYVVHIEHGIARFMGIIRMNGASTEREYLVLQYANGDKLYVPTQQIDRIGRYIGGGVEKPALSRLGTQEWLHTKQRAKEAAQAVASELLALYASREVAPGFAFSADQVWQQELEASFPYVETRDQVSAIKRVKEDMMQPKPMDRLVCGDVGYGKTEVAVRAAFKTVLDGKQVAVLVPTTVLAEQHLITFSQRISAFPAKIEVLSRFRPPAEQETVLKGLANGSVDICIGTHRLLQKDVHFKDLGLLIIDEEQRFGVNHKEHFKQMRRQVDVLTLSATPIPRTLHMSLVGVRDISIMETPPEERLPIKSYVAPYDDRLIREAVLRELERNGQVFFVHNRVQNIAFIARSLKTLVPEARVAVAHGQMAEAELAAVMADFAQGKSDVLVCTTIIESGLDIPNVNTMIINRADRLGLTQLYQLRGRVGRGAETAYAYFLFEPGKRLSATAEKRLKTILEASELGAGFNIAMKDLEIRGAGTLLGTRQSGYISAVGFDLYNQLLADSVAELKANKAGAPPQKPKPKQLPPPSIDLPIAAYLPEDYIPDAGTRLDLYQQLAMITEEKEVAEIALEFKDRFGIPPATVNNLLFTIKIKLLASRAAIESISHEPGNIVLKLFPGMHFDKEKLKPFMQYGIGVGTTQLRINSRRRLGSEWLKVLEEVLRGWGKF